MHVPVDKAGQYKVAADIERRDAVRQSRRGPVTQRGDAPVGKSDIDEAAIGKVAIGQKCVERHASSLAAGARVRRTQQSLATSLDLSTLNRHGQVWSAKPGHGDLEEVDRISRPKI